MGRRKLRYGEVAVAAARLAPPKEVKLRDAKDWKIAGKPVHRLDILDKVLGSVVMMLQLPGMLHASMASVPSSAASSPASMRAKPKRCAA